MALGPIVATLPTTARAWGLFVDGLDVSAEPAATKRYGTELGSLRIRLAGPGGASSLAWQVDDPAKVLSFAAGADVRLERFGDSTPWFRGVLEVIDKEPDFGNQGRTWSLKATGADALPDWCLTDYQLFFGGPTYTLLTTMLQAIVAACGNRGEVRFGIDPASDGGIATLPIGSLAGVDNSTPAGSPTLGLPMPVLIAAGTTMRAAIAMAVQGCQFDLAALGYGPLRFTIDTLLGARAWLVGVAGGGPDGNPTFAMGPASAAGSGERDGLDATVAIRQVTVVGTGVGIRATASDGSGRRGRSITITDPSLDTVTGCQAAAATYLQAAGAGIRGNVTLETSPTETEALMRKGLALTDPAIGVAGTFEISGADVSFDGAARPTFGLTYGARPASAADLIRQYARQPQS